MAYTKDSLFFSVVKVKLNSSTAIVGGMGTSSIETSLSQMLFRSGCVSTDNIKCGLYIFEIAIYKKNKTKNSIG